MSDNDSVTNSNGFVGDWAHLLPEETPVESVGPGHDGIESLAETPGLGEKVTWSASAPETSDGSAPPQEGAESADWPRGDSAPPEVPVETVGPEADGSVNPAEMPSISEEAAGSVAEEQRGDGGVPTDAALSEEGLQVCQETTLEGSVLSSPTELSPSPSSHVPLISDLESHTPFDASAVTGPCPDSDSHYPLGSAPDIYTHSSSDPEVLVADSPAPDTDAHTSSTPESLLPAGPTSDICTHVATEPFAPVSSAPDAYAEMSPALEPPSPENQYPAPVTSAPVLESQEGEEPHKEEEVPEPPEILADVSPQEDFRGDSGPEAPSYAEDGLRRRHVPEPPQRVRDEEEEEEEEEFHLIEKKKEEGGWISLNKCIVGALVLLCLGSIIFTEEDSAQPRDQELHGKQEWFNPDTKLPDLQEVSQMLGKLGEDNQQMSILQAQLQKEKLDLVLQKAEQAGKEAPTGHTENQTSVHSRLWEEQKELATEEGNLEQEEAQMERGPGEGAREDEEEEEEEEKQRMERGEEPAGREHERKRQWVGRLREYRKEGYQGKQWKKGREEGKDWRQWEQRKEKKGESDWKHRKDGGKDKRREWKEKVERRRAWEKGREWYKAGERKRDGAWKDKTGRKDPRQDRWQGGERKGKDWKAQRDWREERKTGKEESRKEKRWQGSAEKKPRALDHVDYWKRQREKLRNNRPPAGCSGAAECARKEGLVPVKQPEFQALLESYLAKLGDHARESKAAVASLAGGFFADGVFAHHEVPFREFAEDVADILEDVAEGDRQAEEAMEGFEREALRRFAVAGGGERGGKDGRMWG